MHNAAALYTISFTTKALENGKLLVNKTQDWFQ